MKRPKEDNVELRVATGRSAVSGSVPPPFKSTSLKGFRFSPFVDKTKPQESMINRIGVPGYGLYPQNLNILRYWNGSAWKAVFKCRSFQFYCVYELVCYAVFGFVNAMRG